MQQIKAEIQQHLESKILPFWMNLKDEEHGGFYGVIDYSLMVDRKADKGGIATARFFYGHFQVLIV